MQIRELNVLKEELDRKVTSLNTKKTQVKFFLSWTHLIKVD